jgi:CDP-diacylglycerol--glycerol-3-phosphate 3-phosphatidyltransferase
MPVADFLSWTRLIAALVLVPISATGNSAAFLVVLAWALLSDAIDGTVARALGTAGVRGARLDSAADCVLFSIAPAASWMVLPAVHRYATADVAIITIAYLAPIALGFAKFGRLTSYHTRAARAAAVLQALGLALLVWREQVWLLHVAVAVLVASAVEESAITRVLPRWHSPVRSWRDARVMIHHGAMAPTILHSASEMSCDAS